LDDSRADCELRRHSHADGHHGDRRARSPLRIEELTSSIEKDILPGLNYSHQIVVNRSRITRSPSVTRFRPIRREAVLHAAILASRDYTNTLVAQHTATVNEPEDQRLFDAFKSARDLYSAAQMNSAREH
jgi:hypothetical protein